MTHVSHRRAVVFGLALMLVWIGHAMASDSPTGHVVLIAHRGGIVPGYPENTIAAFRHAIKNGADVIEIDLHGTKDGEIVIIHDTTLDRTTTGRGKVIDHTLAELKKLDAGRGERIPTYEEVLQLVAGTSVQLLIDIDESPTLDKRKVVELTNRYKTALNVIVGVRTLDDLRTFQRLNPNLRTLGFVRDINEIDPYLLAGVGIVRVWPEWVHKDPTLIHKIHQAGRPVWTTADDAPREELKRLIDLGVDGILTDLPEMMSSLLVELRKSRGL